MMFTCPHCNQQFSLDDFLTHIGNCGKPNVMEGTNNASSSRSEHPVLPTDSPASSSTSPFCCPVCDHLAFGLEEYSDHLSRCVEAYRGNTGNAPAKSTKEKRRMDAESSSQEAAKRPCMVDGGGGHSSRVTIEEVTSHSTKQEPWEWESPIVPQRQIVHAERLGSQNVPIQNQRASASVQQSQQVLADTSSPSGASPHTSGAAASPAVGLVQQQHPNHAIIDSTSPLDQHVTERRTNTSGTPAALINPVSAGYPLEYQPQFGVTNMIPAGQAPVAANNTEMFQMPLATSSLRNSPAGPPRANLTKHEGSASSGLTNEGGVPPIIMERLRQLDNGQRELRQRLELFEASLMFKLNVIESAINRLSEDRRGE